MKRLTPQIIADITGGQYIGDETGRDAGIFGVVRDNRDVKPGNLFVCIKGARVDGHSFANSAYDAGAVCCLAEQVLTDAKGPYVLVKSTLEATKAIGKYYRTLFNIPVIGVTGSVGKTTTKELIAAALGAKYVVHKTPENLNNELGVSLTILSLEERHDAVVTEMGISDFGEMGILADIVRPDILVMTKIGYSHLEKFGDLDGVLQAKSEVFNYMKPDGVAILNGDDLFLRGYDPGMKKITFGLDACCDFRSENTKSDGTDAVTFDIVYDSGRFPVRIPAYGNHLSYLAPAAAAVSRLLGLSNEEISQGLMSYAPVGGRANVTDSGYITIIDDCYNANPHSVRAALDSLSKLSGRRVAILGDMFELGCEAERQHMDIGDVAARGGVDCLICCGDKAEMIYKGFLSAGSDGSTGGDGSTGSDSSTGGDSSTGSDSSTGNNNAAAYYYSGKDGLIPELPELIKRGDVVLVKASHGMKFEELIPLLRNLR